jgi:hypothetical protein
LNEENKTLKAEFKKKDEEFDILFKKWRISKFKL